MQSEDEAWRATAARIARSIWRLAHTPYTRCVAIAPVEIRWSDRAYYRRTAQDLHMLGFEHVGLLRLDAGVGESAHGQTLELRGLADGSVVATVAVVRPSNVPFWPSLVPRLLGRWPEPARFLEFITGYVDGTLLATSNGLGRNPFEGPPEHDRLQLSPGTPPALLFENHVQRMAQRRATSAAAIVPIRDVASYERELNVQRERRCRWRQDMGYVTDAELRGLARQHYLQVRSGVHAELTRLQAESE